MKNLFIVFIVLRTITLSAFAAETPYRLSRLVFETQNIPLINHNGPLPFGSYLTMELPYAPVKKVFNDLQINERTILKNRNEAHITVIDPLEFANVLSSEMDIEEINEIALRNSIQASRFEIVCLGRGTSVLAEKKGWETFYIVVRSPELLKIRQEIERVYLSKGGIPSDKFKANKYFPHITVGYTNEDLHRDKDLLFKSVKTCDAKIKIH